jgi:hypothetical protein
MNIHPDIERFGDSLQKLPLGLVVLQRENNGDQYIVHDGKAPETIHVDKNGVLLCGDAQFKSLYDYLECRNITIANPVFRLPYHWLVLVDNKNVPQCIVGELGMRKQFICGQIDIKRHGTSVGEFVAFKDENWVSTLYPTSTAIFDKHEEFNKAINMLKTVCEYRSFTYDKFKEYPDNPELWIKWM